MDAWDSEGVPMALSQTNEPFDPVKFARSRPRLTMGPLEDVIMHVTGGVLNNVYEWFDAPSVEPNDDDDADTYPYKIK